ncbi:DNA replication and checkpoint protein-domain-containing protein [Schizophyllum amplum]|uniref:DNA replication regulator SLD2 n=1 Tax=Schizophyllum amplum TaxID=97359 RepID=A0A550CMB6_9AGAR|nr:DNA replication and checkpoint protein-domain-containing protein [Auriculariopsis ampla]
MAHDLALKAEIKAWERAFREDNGRDPTIDDIRSQPAVAEKYKLYKKLGKAAASTKSKPSKSQGPPSTPPRGKSTDASTSLLPSTSRVAENTAPLPAFNPFSPQKKKPVRPQASRTTNGSRTNLFASPVKGKAAKVTRRLPSPDPFPEIVPSRTTLLDPFLSEKLPPEPSTAVSRARKRLRGEPVSPSPDKRRRLVSTPLLAMAQSRGSDDEDDPMGGDASFVDDSPVKAPAGFTQLFEEQHGGRSDFKRTSSFALFGAPAKNGAIDSDEDMDTAPDDFGNPMLLAKDNLFADSGPGDDKPHVPSKPSRIRKRSLSLAEMDDDASAQPAPPATHELTLIPPSPPPADSSRKSSYKNAKGKGPAKSTSRKKAKVDDDDDASSSDSEDQHMVKVFNRHPTHAAHEDDDDFDGFDPALLHTNRTAPRLYDEDHDGQAAQDTLEERTTREERRLAEGLVYGRRVGHYDAQKGGEIWGVGEDEGSGDGGDTEEDDWEGEGVPWAAGEL